MNFLMPRLSARFSGDNDKSDNPATGNAAEDSANNNSQPLSNIEDPHPNDVLYGRGGLAQNHVGNISFRVMVAENQEKYMTLTKSKKSELSRGLVQTIRELDPPGRFLKKDDKTGLWFDVGDKEARRKTAQALREGQPERKGKMMAYVAEAITMGTTAVATQIQRASSTFDTTTNNINNTNDDNGETSNKKVKNIDNNNDSNNNNSADDEDNNEALDFIEGFAEGETDLEALGLDGIDLEELAMETFSAVGSRTGGSGSKKSKEATMEDISIGMGSISMNSGQPASIKSIDMDFSVGMSTIGMSTLGGLESHASGKEKNNNTMPSVSTSNPKATGPDMMNSRLSCCACEEVAEANDDDKVCSNCGLPRYSSTTDDNMSFTWGEMSQAGKSTKSANTMMSTNSDNVSCGSLPLSSSEMVALILSK